MTPAEEGVLPAVAGYVTISAMVRIAISFLALVLAALPLPAVKSLQIYFIDVEGGQATLIVSPSGESMLVDAGWPGNNGRDSDRIVAAARLAGVRQIDYLLVTHYHLDHVGGVPELAAKIPVIHYVDHGPNTETNPGAQILSAAYGQALSKGQRIVVKPGDKIPLKGVEIDVVAAGGETLRSAGTPNPACATVASKQADTTENARSVGFILRFGKFGFADLADLTWNKELALVCPSNPMGTADVYLITHHGMDISNSPPVVRALHPRVAIANNGVKKGGSPAAWQAVRGSPGIEDVWQLHYSETGGKENNSPERFIANLEAACQGHWLKLAAEPNGAFTVTNGRNNFSKTYQPKAD
ncbi:MAG: MBL fold metallo-hydrolase [Bryobacteraceae bacterium]